jgi:pyruvate/2-oxoacid:ferredoxin oxidoreductase beta subunit
MAMGVRSRWDQMGWHERPLWCLGGDGAMFDIGFQSLSRLFASGMHVKVFVLDTQVYSNTGGQASTSSYTGQNTKMSVHGKAIAGKQERRKEIAQIAMMHPFTFVAQTTCAHVNHFYRSVLDALEFPGPAIVCCYTTCQPEHGVADNMATDQARLAVDTRAFPLLIYDPRKGDTLKERLSLQGNPAVNEDWWTNPKTGQVVDFLDFARSEGRFSKHFDKDGNPSPTLLMAKQDRLENWHLLQDLAGTRKAPARSATTGTPAKEGLGASAGEKPSAPKSGAQPSANSPAAQPMAPPAPRNVSAGAKGVPAKANGNGKANGEFSVGTRIKYNDGNSWVSGIIASTEPAVLKFDDNTVIETSYEVLKQGAAEGIIVKQ